MVGRQRRVGLRLHRGGGRERRWAHRLGRDLPARPGLPASLRRGRARRHRGAGAAVARPRSLRARRAQRRHGRRHARASLREVGHRHRLLGPARSSQRPAGGDAARRTREPRRDVLPRHLARHAGEDGGAREAVSTRRLPQVPVEGGRRPRRGCRSHPRGRGRAQARRRARGRCQHRLDAARGAARGQRGARRGRLPGTALPHLRAVPRRARAHRPAVRAGRGDRRARHGGTRGGRSGRGRHQPQDLEGGRTHQGPADPRPVRVAGPGHDHRRHVGRRRHHGGHRAPGAQHAHALSVLHHRLQFLRDGEVRRRRAATGRRAHGGLVEAWPRRDAEDEAAGPARN